MLLDPFIKEYNQRTGSKMVSPYNVFNIAVNGEEMPQTVASILAYPCKTLVGGDGDVTTLTFNLETACQIKVSAGETYTEVTLETKFLKESLMSAVIVPFLQHYNRNNGTKKTKSDLKGLVFDGETPLDKLSVLTAQKCHAIIRDPRHTEIRILMS